MSERVQFPWSDEEIQARTRVAVQHYWNARTGQARRQVDAGTILDAGTRNEVTRGQHLNAFTEIICDLIIRAGFDDRDLRFRSGVELPGFFRPLKKWDVVVIRNGRLCAAIEMKSQVGPSFGKNVNNRTEEAVGSAADLWLAFREGLLGLHQPWLGYFFLLEEAPASIRPVQLAPSAFQPDSAFVGTSYAQRYEILCRRMVLERSYSAASLLMSPRSSSGAYHEPASDLALAPFLRALYGHMIGCL